MDSHNAPCFTPYTSPVLSSYQVDYRSEYLMERLMYFNDVSVADHYRTSMNAGSALSFHQSISLFVYWQILN